MYAIRSYYDPLGLILLKGAFADFIYNMTDIDINAELISILDDKKIRLIMIDRFIFDHINEDVTVETLAKHVITSYSIHYTKLYEINAPKMLYDIYLDTGGSC